MRSRLSTASFATGWRIDVLHDVGAASLAGDDHANRAKLASSSNKMKHCGLNLLPLQAIKDYQPDVLILGDPGRPDARHGWPGRAPEDAPGALPHPRCPTDRRPGGARGARGNPSGDAGYGAERDAIALPGAMCAQGA